MSEETIVISLGGSLIVPDEVDVDFLRHFKSLIESQVALGKRFMIITGGGKVCRRYQDSASKIIKISNKDSDMIGIYTCLLNATLVRVILGDIAYPEVITDMSKLDDSIINSVVVLGPNAPGSSSDLGSVQIADKVGAKKIINLSNIDHVYDSDPRTNKNAKKLEKVSWAEYRALIPAEWQPGLSTPFDPVASKMADEGNIEVVILNGKNISNLEQCLNGNDFIGTQIK